MRRFSKSWGFSQSPKMLRGGYHIALDRFRYLTPWYAAGTVDVVLRFRAREARKGVYKHKAGTGCSELRDHQKMKLLNVTYAVADLISAAFHNVQY